ncbi:MAG: polynucleotide adenylyltransferase PcnB, partial [Comamonas sp.]
RAVRFAAKLAGKGFKLDAKTAKPLVECEPLLNDVPQSRLFDEMLKLLQTGHAIASVEQLKALGLSRGIYPLLDVVMERADHPFVQAALIDTDRRVGEGKPVAPSFLLACVLWQDVKTGWEKRLAKGSHPFPALQESIDEVFDARIGDVSGRGKLAADMREIWVMQPRFDKRTGATPLSLVAQPRFRAGFDFLRLRADVGEIEESLAAWWQEFQQANDAVREDLIAQARDEQRARQRAQQSSTPKAPRAPRAKAVREDGAVADSAEPAMLDQVAEDGGAPKKRRRRRRKPAGAEGAEGAGSSGGNE